MSETNNSKLPKLPINKKPSNVYCATSKKIVNDFKKSSKSFSHERERINVSTGISIQNTIPLFHNSSHDECLTTVKIDKARKTGQLELSKSNLYYIPKRVFTIDRLDKTEAESLEVNLDESAELNWWEFKPLEKLDLSFNTIKSIPDDIREIAGLRVIDIQHNSLEEISDEISTLNQIQYLNLSYNKLSTLAIGIYKLKQLKELLAQHNLLKELHEDIGDLSCLVVLDLSYNLLSHIPNGIGFLSSLKELNLSHNELVSLPSDFSGLCGLVKLNLKSNQLSELPSFEHLINLRYIDISINHLKVLTNMENCIMLEHLELNDNLLQELDGNLVSSWSRLKQLYIRQNLITELPSEICTLYSLIILDVSKNNLSTLPEKLSLLPELRCLKIEGNKINGIPANIIESDLIRYLRKTLSFHKGNKTSGVLQEPSESMLRGQTIYDLRKTQHLKYSDSISPIPLSLLKDAVAAHVKSVDIAKNKLIELPPQLQDLQRDLQLLDVSLNCLSSLPPFIGVFSHLNALFLSHNYLTDLPIELEQCETLKELYIDFNRFTNIPNVVYKLTYLERLSAENNSINHIDIEGLAKLKKLAYLELANNSINKLPSELGNMKHIMYVGLTGNLFRHPNYDVLKKPTAYLLQYLRDRL